MKFLFSQLLTVAATVITCQLGAAEKDPALLFEADFDAFDVTANYAKGEKKSSSFSNPSLQLRMWDGVKGKGNALALNNTERCTYPAKANFDPRQGTVSFWVSPLDWRPGEKFIQTFFSFYQKDFQMLVYKYVWPNYLFFYIRYDNAPGNTKTFVASTRAYDADWPLNKWHKIDAVWDRTGMKLYIDGLLPPPEAKANSAPTHPHLKFDVPLDFPAQLRPEAHFVLGEIKSDAQKSRRTAYDNLRIYNRPLSGKEINEEYARYFASAFGSAVTRPLISVPQTTAPVLDGKINAAEWADASGAPLNIRTMFNRNDKMVIDGRFFLKHDGKNLYGAISSDQIVALKKHTARDGNLWEDDSFEMHFRSDKNKEYYQFIVNPANAVFDHKNGVTAWNSGIRSAVHSDGKGWSMEFAIPLTDLGKSPFADDFKGNFYISNRQKEFASYAWTPPAGGGYNSPDSFGRIILRRDNKCVNIASLGALDGGNLDLRLAAQNGGALRADALYELENGVKTTYTGDLFRKPWQVTLPVGRQRLLLNIKDNGRDFYLYEKFYYVNYPLEMKIECLPSAKKMILDLNMNNAGAAFTAQLAKTPGNIALALRDATGKIVAAAEKTSSATVCRMDLPLPQSQVSGEYSLTATVKCAGKEISRTVPFVVPDLTPYAVKTALDHSVPAPWTPIKADGRKFSVLNRTFIFGEGPFPQQITVNGEEIIATPPEIAADGRKIVWSDFKMDKLHPDFAVLSGRGDDGKLQYKWRGELWFDGMYKLDWSVDAAGKEVKVNSLEFTYSLPVKYGRYVARQAYKKALSVWRNNRIEKKFNPVKNGEDNLIWSSGVLRGLAWCSKSDANWVNAPDEANIILSRDAKNFHCRAKIISQPVQMPRQALHYTFILQPTPSRTAPANWRDINYGGYKEPTMQNLQFGGGGDHTFADYQTPQRWTTPSNHKPRWPEKYFAAAVTAKDTWRSKSRLPYHLINYVMPMHLGTNEPEYEYFRHEWLTLPSAVWGYKEDGMPQTIFACCGNTGITDMTLFHLERILRGNKNLGGIYNDCAHSKGCENARHGCGGRDAFGKPSSSVTFLGQREYMMREYKLLKKYGKTLVNHVPAADFIPFVYNFSDCIWPGEEFCGSFALNPDYFYCEGYDLEEYQFAMNPAIRGVGVILLPQPARSTSYVEALKHRRDDFLKNPEWAIRTMTPVLVHGFAISPESIERKTVDRWWIIKEKLHLPQAVFHGYWTTDKVKSASPRVLVSYFELPPESGFKYLLVAGNFGRTAAPLALTSRLPGSEFRDLWHDRPVSAGELQTMQLPGNHFALIAVK